MVGGISCFNFNMNVIIVVCIVKYRKKLTHLVYVVTNESFYGFQILISCGVFLSCFKGQHG